MTYHQPRRRETGCIEGGASKGLQGRDKPGGIGRKKVIKGRRWEGGREGGKMRGKSGNTMHSTTQFHKIQLKIEGAGWREGDRQVE